MPMATTVLPGPAWCACRRRCPRYARAINSVCRVFVWALASNATPLTIVRGLDRPVSTTPAFAATLTKSTSMRWAAT